MAELSKPVFRSTLAGLGGVAGFMFWVLSDPIHDLQLAHPLVLFLWALFASFFVAAMTAMGPLTLSKALRVGAMIGLPVAALVAWASFRFASLSAALDDGQLIIAAALLVSLALPFAICMFRDGHWRSYEALFDTSWRLVVHFTAAWIFTGLCWAVLLLSDALLNLVGVRLIDELVQEQIFVLVFTGLVLGLGLSVIFELSDYISPYLLLSLLRLLLIPVCAIVIVFLLALPLRGLSNLFEDLSPALVMMATAIGLISLISVVVERDDEDAVTGPIMLNVTRLACALVLVLTALAVYAVALRVMAYGWTPPRFAALFVALVTLAYGLGYTIAVLGGADWMERVRRANIGLALGVIGALALCLTPLLNPLQLSVNSQLARYDRGETTADALPFEAFRTEWGRAGTRALAELSERDDPALILALESADLDKTGAPALARREAETAQLRAQMVLKPDGLSFPDAALIGMNDWNFDELRRICVPGSAEPALPCVLIEADFMTSSPEPEYLLVLPRVGRSPLLYWLSSNTMLLRQFAQGALTSEVVIDQILADGFEIVPAQVNALRVGDALFNPFN